MNNYLSPILNNGKALFLAYDHGLEHGPTDLSGASVSPEHVISWAKQGECTGFICQKGIAMQYQDEIRESGVSLIIKLNGKTNLYKGEAYSAKNCDAEFAKGLGAKAVGYTIYPGSEWEYEMLAEFGEIVEDAHKEGLAALAWVYPRGQGIKNDTTPEIIAYAARIGLELGADLVKIKYSGSKESFARAVEAAGRTKVVLSGGPRVGEDQFIKIISEVMSAGAIGAAVGRNIFQSRDPLQLINKIKEIIWL